MVTPVTFTPTATFTPIATPILENKELLKWRENLTLMAPGNSIKGRVSYATTEAIGSVKQFCWIGTLENNPVRCGYFRMYLK